MNHRMKTRYRKKESTELLVFQYECGGTASEFCLFFFFFLFRAMEEEVKVDKNE